MKKYFILILGILVAIPLLLRGGWFLWRVITPSNSNHFETYGAFLSGFLGSAFGFVTIVLLIYFEMARRNESDKREDIDQINSAIKQNREIFNSIKTYEQYRSGKFMALDPEAITIQMSGPETFYKIYTYFIEHYRFAVKEYFATRLTDFVDSLGQLCGESLLNQCQTQWLLKNPNSLTIYQGTYKEQLKKYTQMLPLFEIIDNCSIEHFEEMILRDNAKNCPPNVIESIISSSFRGFYWQYGHLYGHYIRNQYYVFETIEKCKTLSEANKKYYFSLYRSNLSAYELVIMFYNSHSEMSDLGQGRKGERDYGYYLHYYKMLDDLEKIDFVHAEYFKTNGYHA